MSAEHFKTAGLYEIAATVFYHDHKSKSKISRQDNYPYQPKPAFQIYISDDPLPREANWYWGDLHLHSNFTADQIEFAAPVAETAEAAKTIGLDFLAITDHSYDLDDCVDNYLMNDPDLPKWKAYLACCDQQNNENKDFVILTGEEVSAGNRQHKNVHCLVLNDRNFHPGYGDSGENYFSNRPTHSLQQLYQNVSDKAAIIAAHPFEKTPFSQKLALNRGEWLEADCADDRLDALQILNQDDPDLFLKGKDIWIRRLLSGQKIGIVAGNDAHGNFNLCRQITIPLLQMNCEKNHLLGTFRTALFSPSLDKEDLIRAIKNQQAIISSGPFAIFRMEDDNIIEIGGRHRFTAATRLSYSLRSIHEYGPWQKMTFYYGFFETKTEKTVDINFDSAALLQSGSLHVHYPDADYIRMESYSNFENKEHFSITNPIWIDKENLV